MGRNATTCPSDSRPVKATLRGGAAFTLPVDPRGSASSLSSKTRLRYGRRVRLAFRVLNALVALATLASALAVLVSDVVDPGYRAHYRDALWFVGAYTAVQAAMLVVFVRGGGGMRWCVLARTAAAYLFLLGFTVLWPYWKVWTPARYVYLLFEFSDGRQIGQFALVFLGRGAFNTLSALVATEDWWHRLRLDRPLLGRLVTTVPIAIAVFSVWAFLGLVREEGRTFSPEAYQVARMVLEGVDCDAVRSNTGKSKQDVRRRGEQTYGVEVVYDCQLVRVLVQAEDGRVATAAAPRPECCGGS